MADVAGTPGALASVKEIAREVAKEVKDDHVSLSAAGVAFYAFVALIPALAAFLAVYGLVADPQTATEELERFFESLPDEASALLTEQMSSLAQSSTGSLSLTLAVSILVSLWAASAGMAHLVEAVNMVYDQPQERSFVARRALALLLTLGAIVALVVGVFVIAALPGILHDLLPGGLDWLVTALVWLVVAAAFVLGLSLLYRIAPEREVDHVPWITPGAVIAVVAWAVAAGGFSYYVANFGSYNETYGSLAAVVILLLWLFISAFVVLLAGEIDATLESRRNGAGIDSAGHDT